VICQAETLIGIADGDSTRTRVVYGSLLVAGSIIHSRSSVIAQHRSAFHSYRGF
jgi:hypothetical protein